MSRRCGSSKPIPTSNGLAMKPGKREEKQLNETQTLQQGKPPIKNLSRTAGVAGGGNRKALRPTNHRKGTMARQTFVERKGNTGNKIQGRSHAKNLSQTIGMAGVRRGNNTYPEWKVTPPTPREGEERLAETSRANTTHKKR